MREAIEKHKLQSVYDSVAKRYDYQHSFLTWKSDQRGRELLVEKAVSVGDKVLDCGAGTGTTGLLAVRKIGPTGKVVLFDMSCGMLEVAKEKVMRSKLQEQRQRCDQRDNGPTTCRSDSDFTATSTPRIISRGSDDTLPAPAYHLSRNSTNGRSPHAPKGRKRIAGGASPRIGDCITTNPSRGERLVRKGFSVAPSGLDVAFRTSLGRKPGATLCRLFEARDALEPSFAKVLYVPVAHPSA
jgi:SAM-dependent methyltransferase